MRRKAELDRRSHARSDSIRSGRPCPVAPLPGAGVFSAQEPNPLDAVRRLIAGPMPRPPQRVSPIRWRKSWCCICGCARPAPPRRRKSPISCSATPTGRRRRCWSAVGRKPSRRTPTTPRFWPSAALPRRWPPRCCAAPRPSPTPAAPPMPTRWPGRPGSTRSIPPRRGGFPAPLGRHRHARRSMGAVSAPGLAIRPGAPPPPDHPPRSGAPRGGRSPPRRQTGRSADRGAGGRAAPGAASRPRPDPGSRPRAPSRPTMPQTPPRCWHGTADMRRPARLLDRTKPAGAQAAA